MVFNITVLGSVSKKNLKLRSDAKEGDLLRVTGPLGGAGVGRILLKRKFLGHEPVKTMYLEPYCRLDLVDQLAPYANAMIDVSDGVASEVTHICKQSKLGAEIFLDKIPFKQSVMHACRALRLNPVEFAMFGGEDYQLLYTVSPENEEKTPGTTIGKMVKGSTIMLHNEKLGTKSPLKRMGYQHF